MKVVVGAVGVAVTLAVVVVVPVAVQAAPAVVADGGVQPWRYWPAVALERWVKRLAPRLPTRPTL